MTTFSPRETVTELDRYIIGQKDAKRAVAVALRKADASLIAAFDFLRLPFTALFGFLLFAEVPDEFVWLGAAIIFASTYFIARREAKKQV